LESSLSIVLPVHHSEPQLVDVVEQVLELAGELTPSFEVLILGDATTDNTEEFAAELARRYPQVRYASSSRSLGSGQTIKSAIERTSGDVVLLYDHHSPLSARQLRRLWALRNDPQVVIARAEAERPRPISSGLLDRVSAWGETLRQSVQKSEPQGGVQMIRRQGVADLADCESPQRELRLDRVEGAECLSRGGRSAMARPSFLARLKSFPAAE
jgi:glycosyltransferase involved in cell wall biosynthesis